MVPLPSRRLAGSLSACRPVCENEKSKVIMDLKTLYRNCSLYRICRLKAFIFESHTWSNTHQSVTCCNQQIPHDLEAAP
ncbi:hypothetical protein CapIbe_008661 [Capra ibex]